MSHISLTYHIVLSTRNRENVIFIDHERELYKFIYNFATDRGIKIWRMGGMPDHIHILCDIPPKYALSDIIQLLKSESSKFMKANFNFSSYWKGWSEGFGAFTVDSSLRQARIKYITGQKEHHGRMSFIDEYRELLIDAGYDLESLQEELK